MVGQSLNCLSTHDPVDIALSNQFIGIRNVLAMAQDARLWHALKEAYFITYYGFMRNTSDFPELGETETENCRVDIKHSNILGHLSAFFFCHFKHAFRDSVIK